MSKDFEALIARKTRSVLPLTREEREKMRIAYGQSFAFSLAARYEATIELLERNVGIVEEKKNGVERRS